MVNMILHNTNVKIHVLGCEIIVYMFIYRSLQYTFDKMTQMCKKRTYKCNVTHKFTGSNLQMCKNSFVLYTSPCIFVDMILHITNVKIHICR